MLKTKQQWRRCVISVTLIVLSTIGLATAGVKSGVNPAGNVEIQISDTRGISNYFVYVTGQLAMKGAQAPEARATTTSCPKQVTLELTPAWKHAHSHKVIYGTCSKQVVTETYVTKGDGLRVLTPAQHRSGIMQR